MENKKSFLFFLFTNVKKCFINRFKRTRTYFRQYQTLYYTNYFLLVDSRTSLTSHTKNAKNEKKNKKKNNKRRKQTRPKEKVTATD